VKKKGWIVFCLGILGLPLAAMAETPSWRKILENLYTVAAPTGNEDRLAQAIMGTLSRGLSFERDSLGSLYLAPEGSPDLPAFCTPLDEPGYFISGFHPDGFLHLDRAVPVPPRVDAFYPGHAMIVWTGSGTVEGVLILPSLHIMTAETRKKIQERPALEWTLLDIGALSETEARARGVEMMDPVTPHRRITPLAGGQMSGHSLAGRICISLLVDLAGVLESKGEVGAEFVWVAQSRMLSRGSGAPASVGAEHVSRRMHAKRRIVVDVFPLDPEQPSPVELGRGPVLVPGKDPAWKETFRESARGAGIPIQEVEDHASPLFRAFLEDDGDALGLFLPVQYPLSPSEVVDARDVEGLADLLRLALKEKGRRR